MKVFGPVPGGFAPEPGLSRLAALQHGASQLEEPLLGALAECSLPLLWLEWNAPEPDSRCRAVLSASAGKVFVWAADRRVTEALDGSVTAEHLEPSAG